MIGHWLDGVLVGVRYMMKGDCKKPVSKGGCSFIMDR